MTNTRNMSIDTSQNDFVVPQNKMMQAFQKALLRKLSSYVEKEPVSPLAKALHNFHNSRAEIEVPVYDY